MVPTSRNSQIIAIGAAIAVAALVIGAILLPTSRQQVIPAPTDKITIATSIFPLTDIARNIGADSVNVVQLVPPGASPHTYALNPQQLIDLQRASVLFVIGHGLDTSTTKAVAQLPNLRIVVVDKNIRLRPFAEGTIAIGEDEDEHEEEPGSVDPHYWLTVPNAQSIARTITATLQDLDPAHTDQYEQNLAVYTAQLNQLENELQTTASRAEQKKFITIHNAWSYFAEQYGLELLATYEPIEGREPSIADLQRLQSLVQQNSIRIFFTEPQKETFSAARLLEQDLGLEIRVLDPVGGVDERDSYITLMKANMAAIAR